MKPLPGQGRLLHFRGSLLGPSLLQSLPLLAGGGLVQDRDRV